MRLAEIAAVTGGRLHRAGGQEIVTGAAFDSRQITGGELFVALPGRHTDGHCFAAEAIARGAVAVLADRDVDAPAVIVAPVLAALGSLARAGVERTPGTTVIGVTGSCGKTSTKDLLAAVLAPLGPTIAPTGSFNNELGLPMTVLRADAGTRHLVVEMSARARGHIATLCRIAPPRVGVVLNVGSAHLETFGSRAGIAEAKGELVESLPAAADGGIAVLNADDPLVAGMAARTRARIVTTGRGPADIRAADVRLVGGRARFNLVTPSGTAAVTLRLVGEHHVANALAAAAVALELGNSPHGIATVLSRAPGTRWRMEIIERPDGVTIINDAYNASPESMTAALRALTETAQTRRTWAVLGPMGELGATSAAAHADIATTASAMNIDNILAVDAPGYTTPDHAVRHVPDSATAVALLRVQLRPGDIVLVKASRAAQLEQLVTALLDHHTR